MKPQLITKTGRERMQKMISYLRALPPARFNFGVVAQDECGSVGCAIGHTPHVFPNLCRYDRYYPNDPESVCVVFADSTREEIEDLDYPDVGYRVFGLQDRLIAKQLFTPRHQSRLAERHGIQLESLRGQAKPTQVADMLESFLSQVDDID